MRKVVSALLALILCISLILSAIPGASAATGDEVRAAKKIISVVYDDSGSMYGERWVYANYAMQALTALLNTQDELYITYMSQPYTATGVNLSDINSAVTGIRNWKQSSNTPGTSLETAKSTLDGISETDPSAQFWLVILTDGSIEMSETIQSRLNSYKGSKMSNGSTLNVVYLAMGSGAVTCTSDKRGGLYAFDAANMAEITDTMADIANLISSRVNVDKVKQIDDKTISFQSDLPLYSISVLTQQSSASVVSAQSTEGALKVDRNVSLDAYDPFFNTSTTLFGNAAVINLTDGSGVSSVIQPGTYTITFSEPVDTDDLVVQYEPAIGMKMKVTRSGVEVTDTSTLAKGDKVSIELTPVVPGTDQEISKSSLPNGISWTIEYIVDNQPADNDSSNKLTDVILKEGDNMIRGTMQIPGFAPSVYEIYFEIPEIIYNFGIQIDQPEPLSYYRRNSGDGSVEGGTLTFWITNDGTPLSKEEQKSLNLKLEVTDVSCDDSKVEGFLNRFGKVPASCNLKRNDDGSYTLTPNPIVPFTSFLTKAGDYTVTVSLNRDDTVTATGRFTLVAQLGDWFELGGLVLTISLLAYLIFILFIKYKFTGQTVCYEAYKLRYDGTGIPLVSDATTIHLSPLTLDLLLPKRACEVKFYGLTLQAGPDGTVIVTGKSIAKQVSHYKTSSMDPKTALGSIVASMQATERTRGKKTERTASDQVLSINRPVFFRSVEGDKTIWCLHLMQ